MAIKTNLSIKSNLGNSVIFENAYVKVLEVTSNKSCGFFDVGIYETENGRIICTSRHNFTPKMDFSNFIAQAYNYLKTLPEFSGAVDC